MSTTPANPAPQTGGRGVQTAVIASLAALTISASGFFMGLRATSKSTVEHRQAWETPAAVPTVDDAGTDIPVVVEYSKLHANPIRPNTEWKNSLANLAPPEPARASFSQLSDAEKELIRIRRISRRQYDGAPPVSPHPLDQSTAAACLECHGKPTFISGIAVPQMSHELHANCLQCHVSSAGPTSTWRSRPVSLASGNGFSGKPLPGFGERAYPGAPPVIPHTTWMRENCTSCHGPTGTSDFRTSHPERANCRQCHATNAVMDQRPNLVDFGNSIPPPLPGGD